MKLQNQRIKSCWDNKLNYRLVSFDHTKTSTAKVSSPIVDLEVLAKLTGKALSVGSANVPKREILTTSGATPTITLAATPVTGTLQVYLLDGDRDVGTLQSAGTPASQENTYSGTVTLTFNATTAPAGTRIVAYYNYATAATTQTITMTADQFAPYMKMVGTGIATDLVTGASDVPVIFELLKVKPKNTVNFTLKSTEATQLEFDLDLFSVLNTTTNEQEYFKMYILA